MDFVIAQGSEGGGHTGTIVFSLDTFGSRRSTRTSTRRCCWWYIRWTWSCCVHDVRCCRCVGWYVVSLTRNNTTRMLRSNTGTRFLLTHEARTHRLYKEYIVKSRSSDTVITRAFTGFPLRAIKNKYTNEYEKSDTKVHSSVKSIQDGVCTTQRQRRGSG